MVKADYEMIQVLVKLRIVLKFIVIHCNSPQYLKFFRLHPRENTSYLHYQDPLFKNI
jgi:hypothetical protein